MHNNQNVKSTDIIPLFCSPVKKNAAAIAAAFFLLSAEGHAVGALIHGGIGLMGADLDPIQRAVVLGFAVVGALMNGALHALVGMAAHNLYLLLRRFRHSLLRNGGFMQESSACRKSESKTRSKKHRMMPYGRIDAPSEI